MDLLSLARQDTGAEFRKAASTDGGEYAGPCPICKDGDDRFHVWPNHPKGKARWWCRICGRGGDLADYLQVVRGMTVKDSLRAAGVDSVPQGTTARPRPPTVVVEPPLQLWQMRAQAFVQYAQDQLWSEKGQSAREYLKAERGLADETIRHFGLGYNPQAWYCKSKNWGLDDRRKVYVSPVIVIPCWVGDVLWYVQVRRPSEDDPLAAYLEYVVRFRPEVKYWTVKGGRGKVLFGVNDLRGDAHHLLFCEGEFDTMLAWQELNDLVDVATLGGAAKGNSGIHARWLRHLIFYRLILVAYDVDENKAGDRGAAKLLAQSRRAVRVKVPRGGDLTGFWQLGGDLQDWLARCLAQLDLRAQTG